MGDETDVYTMYVVCDRREASGDWEVAFQEVEGRALPWTLWKKKGVDEEEMYAALIKNWKAVRDEVEVMRLGTRKSDGVRKVAVVAKGESTWKSVIRSLGEVGKKMLAEMVVTEPAKEILEGIRAMLVERGNGQKSKKLCLGLIERKEAEEEVPLKEMIFNELMRGNRRRLSIPERKEKERRARCFGFRCEHDAWRSTCEVCNCDLAGKIESTIQELAALAAQEYDSGCDENGSKSVDSDAGRLLERLFDKNGLSDTEDAKSGWMEVVLPVSEMRCVLYSPKCGDGRRYQLATWGGKG